MSARLFFALMLLFAMPCARAAEFAGIPVFIDEMVAKHQFNREDMVRLFQRAQRRQSIIDAISAPATRKPWPEYRANFINSRRVNGGLQFWQQYRDALQRAEKQYGVPQEIIVALIGVETSYGRNAGKYSTLDALTTLAFDYPRRADFFRSELEQYLLLAREQEFDLLKVQGSYAGALGIPQFMPGSYRRYAVDFSGDGRVDLLHDPLDAIGSVANYMNKYGWINGEPVTVPASAGVDYYAARPPLAKRNAMEWAMSGIKPEQPTDPDRTSRLIDFTVDDGKEYWLAFGNFDVIRRYNNSDYYAMSVFQLAEALREARNEKIADVR